MFPPSVLAMAPPDNQDITQDDKADEICEKVDAITETQNHTSIQEQSWDAIRLRLLKKYGISVEVDGIAPRTDINPIVDQTLQLQLADALKILQNTVENHAGR